MLPCGPRASSISVTQELVKMQKLEPLLHPHLHVQKIPWVLPMGPTFCKRLAKSTHPQSVLSRPGTSASPENLVGMQNHGLILNLVQSFRVQPSNLCFHKPSGDSRARSS